MTQTFDLLVIGTGSAASAVAMHCSEAGWRVAIVDGEPFGGTCALRGCDPKKVLTGVAESLEQCRRMEGKGIAAENLHIDWSQLMRFKRSFTEPVPQRREEEYKKAGIVTFHGQAQFVGRDRIKVGERELQGKKVVIATGAAPEKLTFPGAEYLATSDQFLDMSDLPRRILLVGGGYIAMEFAHLAAIAGAQVTVLHQGSRPLERFDPDLVGLLVERTRQLGVDLQVETRASAIEKGPDFVVRASQAGKDVSYSADMVVHAAGRTPQLDDLDLAAAGIEWEKRGVCVNEFLQSVSNPAVYAAGDAAATDGPPLSPVAAYEGRVVVSNLLEGNSQKTNYLGVPSVVFTTPALASAGLTEQAAHEQDLKFTVRAENTSHIFPSRRIAEPFSGYKVIVEDETDRILGAHLLGSEAAELINVFAVAIRSRIPAKDLEQTLFAYPSSGAYITRMLRRKGKI
jgi:glutathione reductase (NADPH)